MSLPHARLLGGCYEPIGCLLRGAFWHGMAMTLGTNCLMNINEEGPLAAESKDPPVRYIENDAAK